MAFLEHIQRTQIPFPWELFEKNAIKTQQVAKKARRKGKPSTNQDALLPQNFQSLPITSEESPSSQFQPDQINNASIEIKRHYKANKTLLAQLKQGLKSHGSNKKQQNQKAIIRVIRNNRGSMR